MVDTFFLLFTHVLLILVALKAIKRDRQDTPGQTRQPASQTQADPSAHKLKE